MTSILNKILQGIAVAGQLFTMYGGAVPGKYQGYVATGIGIAQSVIGILAHKYNPDGTPASVAYVPPTK